MKSGNLNFLEPSGPLQACNGTDLPFTVRVICCNRQQLSTLQTQCLYMFCMVIRTNSSISRNDVNSFVSLVNTLTPYSVVELRI